MSNISFENGERNSEKVHEDRKGVKKEIVLQIIMDLFNNEIVAYKLYDHQQTPLVIDTLKEALAILNHPEGMSDQGSVYTLYVY